MSSMCLAQSSTGVAVLPERLPTSQELRTKVSTERTKNGLHSVSGNHDTCWPTIHLLTWLTLSSDWGSFAQEWRDGYKAYTLVSSANLASPDRYS